MTDAVEMLYQSYVKTDDEEIKAFVGEIKVKNAPRKNL